MTLVLVIVIVWFLICLFCLRDAWRSKTLHPLLGSQRITRGFWILLIVLCNPILIGLYAVFGRFKRTASLATSVRLTIVLSVAGWGIWMQLGGPGTPRTMGDVKQDGVATPSGLLIGSATFEHSSSYSSARHNNGPLAPRSIRVLYGEDHLARDCAHSIARDLAKEWWTDEVILWPENTPLQFDVRGPDYTINVSTEDASGWPTPILQIWSGTLLVTGSCAPYPMGPTSSFERLPQPGSIEYKGEIDFHFKRFGSALGGHVQGELTENLSEEVRSGLIEDLRAFAASGQRFQHREANLQPREAPIPEALATRKLTTLGKEFAPHVHERTWFRFDDRRSTEAVLMELNDELEAQGWNPSWGKIKEGESSILRMDFEGLQLTVGRWPRPEFRGSVWIDGVKQEQADAPVSASPFIARLVSYFTEEEYEELARTYATDPVDLGGLLSIHGKFKREDALRALQVAMRKTPRPDASFWLQLARLDQELGDSAAAQRAIQTAHALVRFEFTGSLKRTVQTCADDLQVDLESISYEVAHELLLESGLQHFPQGTGHLDLVLGVGEEARILGNASPDFPPSQFIIQVRSLSGEAALHCQNMSYAMSHSQDMSIGQNSGIGMNNAFFNVTSKRIGDEISIRVSNGSGN